MRDLTILMDMQRGRPAELLAAVGEHGIDIVGACLFARLEERVAHAAMSDDDAERFVKLASRLGVTVVDGRECVVVPPDYPGGPVAAGTKLRDAGVDVYIAYFGIGGQLILGTMDANATRRALGLDLDVGAG